MPTIDIKHSDPYFTLHMTHSFSGHRPHLSNRPESRLSNNDSLLQEFREFEAQIYSGDGDPEEDLSPFPREAAQSSSFSFSNPDDQVFNNPQHQNESPEELELVNPHPVLPFAQEDPIETHDLVVAKMAADGAVWVPQSTPSVRHPDSHAAVPSTSPGSFRWHSAEIEEDRVCPPPKVSDPSWQFPDTSQQRPPLTLGKSNPSRPLPPERIPCSASRSSIASTNRSQPTQQSVTSSPRADPKTTATFYHVTKQSDSPVSSTPIITQQSQPGSTQVDLEVKLTQEVTRRKQQDDYIRQLQMYYDNLLAKHALAEVTIDQLRMGAQVRTDSEERRLTGFDGSGSRPPFSSGLHRSMQYLSQPVGPQSASQSGSMFLPSSSQFRPTYGEAPTTRYASTPFLRLPSPSIENRRLPPPPPRQLQPPSDQQNNQSRFSAFDLNHVRDSMDSNDEPRCALTNSVSTGTLRRRFSIETPRELQPQQTAFNEGMTHTEVTGSHLSDRLATISLSGTGSSHCLSRKSAQQNSPPEQTSYHSNAVSSDQHRLSFGSGLPTRPQSPLAKPTNSQEQSEQYSDSVRLHLLFRIKQLQASLSGHQRRFVETGEAPTKSQLEFYREDYSLLKKCFQAAKQHWNSSTEEFDSNHSMDKDIFQLGLQLDDLETCFRIRNSVLNLPADTVDSRLHNAQSPNQQQSFVTTTQSHGVTETSSSPGRSNSLAENGSYPSSLQSSSPAKETFCALDSLYLHLLDQYKMTVKQQPPLTAQRAQQLHDLMKHLFDLAHAADGQSRIIPTADELENMFQMDANARNLDETLNQAGQEHSVHSQVTSSPNLSGGGPNRRCTKPTEMHSSSSSSSARSSQSRNRSYVTSRNAPITIMQMPQKPTQLDVSSSTTQDSGLFTPSVTSIKVKTKTKPPSRTSSQRVPTVPDRCPIPADLDASSTVQSTPTYGTRGRPSDGSLLLSNLMHRSARTVNQGSRASQAPQSHAPLEPAVRYRNTKAEALNLNRVDERSSRRHSNDNVTPQPTRRRLPTPPMGQQPVVERLREADSNSDPYVTSDEEERTRSANDSSTESDTSVRLNVASSARLDHHAHRTCPQIPTAVPTYNPYPFVAHDAPSSGSLKQLFRRKLNHRVSSRTTRLVAPAAPVARPSLPTSTPLMSARCYVVLDSEPCPLCPPPTYTDKDTSLCHCGNAGGSFSDLHSSRMSCRCFTCGGTGEVPVTFRGSMTSLVTPTSHGVPHLARTSSPLCRRVMSSGNLVGPEPTYPVREYSAWGGHRYYFHEFQRHYPQHPHHHQHTELHS